MRHGPSRFCSLLCWESRAGWPCMTSGAAASAAAARCFFEPLEGLPMSALRPATRLLWNRAPAGSWLCRRAPPLSCMSRALTAIYMCAHPFLRVQQIVFNRLNTRCPPPPPPPLPPPPSLFQTWDSRNLSTRCRSLPLLSTQPQPAPAIVTRLMWHQGAGRLVAGCGDGSVWVVDDHGGKQFAGRALGSAVTAISRFVHAQTHPCHMRVSAF
jgi:hypothetical protein